MIQECVSRRFVRGQLHACGANSFDVVSIHLMHSAVSRATAWNRFLDPEQDSWDLLLDRPEFLVDDDPVRGRPSRHIHHRPVLMRRIVLWTAAALFFVWEHAALFFWLRAAGGV